MAQEPYEQQHSGFLTIENEAKELLNPSTSASPGRPQGWMTDAQWVRQSFIVDTDHMGAPMLDPIDQENRIFSSASLKFEDTSLGGNQVINPPPSFTRYADPPYPGYMPGATQQITPHLQAGHLGMAPYYSEAIDDNSQVIHMRFGVPSFNSLTQFFTGFYSSRLGNAARAGRFTDSFVNTFLRGVGQVVALALVPMAILPAAILMAGTAMRYFMNWPASKFMTMKPAMELYWNAVTTMVNQIGAHQGIVTYLDSNQAKNIMGQGRSFDSREKGLFGVLTDGAINERGSIDVFAIANRSKRMEMAWEENIAQVFEESGQGASPKSIEDIIKSSLTQRGQFSNRVRPGDQRGPSLEAMLDSYWQRAKEFSGFTSDTEKGIETDPRTIKDDGTYEKPNVSSDLFAHILANWGDGADWASFRVDYTGPVSESFSNSLAPSSLQQKINSITSSAHDIRMNFSGAVESIPGASTVVDAVKTVVGTVGSTLHVEGLFAFAGSAFVDIPQHWESSSANLPRSNYSMTLISPYGNPISRMFDIFLPLSMILAGALPLSYGKQSHGSPFYVELHDRGRALTRLGIIDSLSISRGTSNLGFTNEGQVLAIDVNFSVVSCDTVASVPIASGFSENVLSDMFDGDNAFQDYLMAMSGVSMKEMIYRFPLLKNQINRTLSKLDAFTSTASIGQFIANMPGVNAMSAIMRGTSKN